MATLSMEHNAFFDVSAIPRTAIFASAMAHERYIHIIQNTFAIQRNFPADGFDFAFRHQLAGQFELEALFSRRRDEDDFAAQAVQNVWTMGEQPRRTNQ